MVSDARGVRTRTFGLVAGWSGFVQVVLFASNTVIVDIGLVESELSELAA